MTELAEDKTPTTRNWGRTLLVAAIAFAVIAQLIPINRTNPPVRAQPKWDSQRTKELAQRACYDCHSNETNWPWYSYIAPVSWLVAYDTYEGRSEFNLSEEDPGEADEAAEMVEEGEMPPWIYVIAHPEAKLTKSETAELVAGLTATFGGEGSGEHDDEAHE